MINLPDFYYIPTVTNISTGATIFFFGVTMKDGSGAGNLDVLIYWG